MSDVHADCHKIWMLLWSCSNQMRQNGKAEGSRIHTYFLFNAALNMFTIRIVWIPVANIILSALLDSKKFAQDLNPTNGPGMKRMRRSRAKIVSKDMEKEVKLQQLVQFNYNKRHEALVNHNDENECKLCWEDDGSLFHIVAECPSVANFRHWVFGTLFLRLPLTWSIRQITSFLWIALIGSLLDQTLLEFQR